MSKSRCIERIYGSRCTSHQCTRSAGYGPNGDYCKQHGRRHEKVSADLSLWETSPRWIDWENPIKKIKVREIGASTFIDSQGSRNRMESEFNKYFRTLNEAKSYILERAKTKRANNYSENAIIDECIAKLKP